MDKKQVVDGPIVILRAKGWKDYGHLVPEDVYCDSNESCLNHSVDSLMRLQEEGKLTVMYFVDSDWPETGVDSAKLLQYAEGAIKRNGWPRNYESVLAAWNNLFLG